jgi:hypothetical protein
VIDIEHEHPVTAELEVIPDARLGDVEEVLFGFGIGGGCQRTCGQAEDKKQTTEV